MSYQNRLDEISEKLIRLQSNGGITRPLVPAESNGDFGAALARKLDEVAEGVSCLKSEMFEFRKKTLSQLGEIDQKLKKLSAAGTVSSAEKEAAASVIPDNAFGNILDEISALKENIKTALTMDGE